VAETFGKAAKLGHLWCAPGIFRVVSALQSRYHAKRIGDLAVNRNRRPMSGWTIVVLGVAALALGACGRKAGLDMPPAAYAPPAPAAAPVDTQAEAASKPTLFNPGFGMDAAPAAPKGQKKSFLLDPLLDK
jgi:predicted small lipoprotein YifL